jgi:hypothetical protein
MGFMVAELRRLKSRRCWSSDVAVFIDQPAEDRGASHPICLKVVGCGRLSIAVGW